MYACLNKSSVKNILTSYKITFTIRSENTYYKYFKNIIMDFKLMVLIYGFVVALRGKFKVHL